MADIDAKNLESSLTGAVKKATAPLETHLKSIDSNISKIGNNTEGVEAATESKRAEKVAAADSKTTISLLGKILGATAKTSKGAAKAAGGGLMGMLKGILGLGLAVSLPAFFALLGGLAGVMKSIVDSPAFKLAKTAFKIMAAGAKGLFGGLSKVGGLAKPLGWLGDKLGGLKGAVEKLMSNKTFTSTMGSVSKFLTPFTRLASWIFMGAAFFKNWGKADEIFGKGEGDATIVEKFASGLGGIIDFMSFGFIDVKTAAVSLKKTFDYFKFAVSEPQAAWQQIVDWWNEFSFDTSIVQPMLKMFKDFPKTVSTFIDGPLSNFGSTIGIAIKEFIFGKSASESEGATGGLLGSIKSFFSAENVVNAVKGAFSIGAGFYTMLGSLVSIPLIGTKGKWTDLESWGGLFGFIKNDVFNWSNIKGVVSGYFDIVGALGTWMGDIFSSLFTAAMEWIGGLFDADAIIANIKKSHPTIAKALDLLGFDTDTKDEKITAKQDEINKMERNTKYFGKDETEEEFAARKEAAQKELTGMKGKVVTGSPVRKLSHLSFASDKIRENIKQSAAINPDLAKMIHMSGNAFSSQGEQMRITSGFRNKESQAKAMEGLRKRDPKQYEKNYGADAGNDSATEEWLKTHASRHQSGNAIDVSYPKGVSRKSILSSLNSSFGKDGGYAVGEGDHIHINTGAKTTAGASAKFESKFNALNSPQDKTSALNSLQTENAQGKMTSGQSAPTIVSAPQTTTNNSNSSTSLLLPPTAKDSFWDNAV